MRKDKIKIGFVGFGNRVENVYMPLFKKAESIFEISGFYTRRADRETEVIDKFGIKSFKSNEEVCKNSDVVIAFCPTEVQYDVLTEITKFSDHRTGDQCPAKILLETPVTDHRIAHLDMSTSSNICVAEQWPFLPLEQFKNSLIESKTLSRPFLVQNDCRTLDYHAIAQLRTYLGRDVMPVRVFGSSVGANIPRFMDKNGNIKEGPEFWDIAQVIFSSGAILSHNFSYNCKIAPFRSMQTLRYYSDNGTVISGKKDDKDNDYEIVDVRYLDKGLDTNHMNVLVKKSEAGATLEISDSASGISWMNPYGNIGLTDQETAMCTLVASLAEGNVLYSTRDAFLDSLIMNAIKQSCSSGQLVNFG